MLKSTNNGSDCWQGDKGYVKHIVCLTIEWYCHLDLESSEIKKYVFVHRNDVTGATETCFLIEIWQLDCTEKNCQQKCFKLSKYIYQKFQLSFDVLKFASI